MTVSDSLAENNGLVIHGKESPLLPSRTDATFAFLEVVGRQAGEQTEPKPRLLPEESKLD